MLSALSLLMVLLAVAIWISRINSADVLELRRIVVEPVTDGSYQSSAGVDIFDGLIVFSYYRVDHRGGAGTTKSFREWTCGKMRFPDTIFLPLMAGRFHCYSLSRITRDLRDDSRGTETERAVVLPLWAAALFCSILPVFWLWSTRPRRSAKSGASSPAMLRPGNCPRCGARLPAVKDPYCPECRESLFP